MADGSAKTIRKLQILGAGCAKCKQLAENTEQAAKAMGLAYELTKVTDIAVIMKYGVLMTPALVVDGVVKAVGKALTTEQIKGYLS